MSDQIGEGEYQEGLQDPPAPPLSIRRRRMLQEHVTNAAHLALAVEAHAHWLGTFTGGESERAYRNEMKRIKSAYAAVFGKDYTEYLPEK